MLPHTLETCFGSLGEPHLTWHMEDTENMGTSVAIAILGILAVACALSWLMTMSLIAADFATTWACLAGIAVLAVASEVIVNRLSGDLDGNAPRTGRGRRDFSEATPENLIPIAEGTELRALDAKAVGVVASKAADEEHAETGDDAEPASIESRVPEVVDTTDAEAMKQDMNNAEGEETMPEPESENEPESTTEASSDGSATADSDESQEASE